MSRKPYTLDGRGAAVVTGASAGLGVEFAVALAAKGYDLVLVARREERLQSLARHLRAAHGVRVEVMALDLASTRAAEKLHAHTRQENLDVGLLVNNAGFGWDGAFADMPLARQQEMAHLNMLTLTQLCRLYLPDLAARAGGGGIINVSSVAGFFAVPRHAVYAATKAYVNSFGQALALEAQPEGVRVLTYCPGPMRTEFSQVAGVGVKNADFFFMNPREAVRLCLKAFDQGEVMCVPGAMNAGFLALARLLPQNWVSRGAMALLSGEA